MSLQDKTCDGCKFVVGWECRRFPPTPYLRQTPGFPHGEERDCMWSLAGTRCGEYRPDAVEHDGNILEIRRGESPMEALQRENARLRNRVADLENWEATSCDRRYSLGGIARDFQRRLRGHRLTQEQAGSLLEKLRAEIAIYIMPEGV